MGGLKLAKPIEIIEAPKVSEAIKLDISLRLPERPILNPIPEAPGVTGGLLPTADPKMVITPNLKSNPGAKLHMDLDAVMAKDPTGKTYLTHQMLQSPPNSKMMGAFAVTFGVLGVVMIPGMASWMMEHGGSILGFMGLPLFGMVMGGVAKEAVQSGRITRYRDLARFHEDYWKLDASGGEPKTIKWEGMEEGVGYHHKIFTIGTVNRLGEEIKIDVETSSETDEFHLGPDWRFYDMTIYTTEELGSQSEQLAEDFFSTTLVIHTTDPAKVETIHQQFVAEYQRTGSAQAALDWLMNSPWGPAMFELQEARVGGPKVEIISGAEQNQSLVAKTPADQEMRSEGIFQWLARRVGSIYAWQNYAQDMERAGNISEAKKAHEKVIGLSLKEAQKFEIWRTEGMKHMHEVGAREKDYAEFLERHGLLEEASLHYDAAAKALSKGELNEFDRFRVRSVVWKAYEISLKVARKAERRRDFLNAGIFYERAGRNVLPSDFVPRELRGKWDSTQEALLNFAKAAFSFKKAGEAHQDLFEGVLSEIPGTPYLIYAGKAYEMFFQELIEFLRKNDSNLQSTNQLIRRGPQ